MKQFRLFADQDGESHFEELEIKLNPVEYAPTASVVDFSEQTDATGYLIVRVPSGWDGGLHTSPRRQLMVILSGTPEYEVSDGTTMNLTAGDVVLLEDTTGKGHTSRAKGGNEVLALLINLD